jgi:NTE family protein
MKKGSIFLFLIIGIIVFGCGCPQCYKFSNNPPPLPDCPVVPQTIRLALILGGGGAKGLAHVGVLEELESAGIPIDLIVGCSAGSIVGALYADNPSCDYLKKCLLNLKPRFLVDFDLWNAQYGLCQGRSLRRFLKANLSVRTFDQLKLPFFLVATDLYSSELVVIGGGPIIPAIEASCAIPFFFVPVALHGRAFVDGGVIDPVPVRVAKLFDAEITVAVDLRCLLPQSFPTNLFGVAARSAEITLLWQSENCIHDADLVIRPQLMNVSTFDNDHNEMIYQAGRLAARQCIPEIQALLAKKSFEKQAEENSEESLESVQR